MQAQRGLRVLAIFRQAGFNQGFLRDSDTSIAIPRRCLGNIGLGLWRDEDRHIPSCLRISASATAQDTPAPGFWR